MRFFAARVALIVLVFSTSGFAQLIGGQGIPIGEVPPPALLFPSQLNFTGAGASSAGMGGAFLAVSNDVSAGSWNPAGLKIQRTPMLGLSRGAFVPRGTFEFNNTLTEQNISFNDLEMGSFIAPLRIKGHHIVASISISSVDDEYFSGSVRDSFPFDSDLGGNNFEPTTVTLVDNTSFESGLKVINLSFGTGIKGNLSFGSSMNIYMGSGLTTNELQFFLPKIQFIPVGGVLQPVDIFARQITTDSTSYSGVNFTIGFLYEGTKLNFGLVARSPYSLEMNIDRRIDALVFANGLEFGGEVILEDNKILKLDMPFTIGGGIAYRPNEKFLFAFDGEYRAFSGKKGRQRTSLTLVPGSDNIETFEEFDPEWRSVFTVRTGGEYKWSTGSEIFPSVPIRAGFAYAPLPGDNDVNAVSISVGSGIHWNQIHLDAAFVRTTYTIEGIFTGFTEQLPVTQEIKNNRFKFTFTGYF